jgi:hypothetical protein
VEPCSEICPEGLKRQFQKSEFVIVGELANLKEVAQDRIATIHVVEQLKGAPVSQLDIYAPVSDPCGPRFSPKVKQLYFVTRDEYGRPTVHACDAPSASERTLSTVRRRARWWQMRLSRLFFG